MSRTRRRPPRPRNRPRTPRGPCDSNRRARCATRDLRARAALRSALLPRMRWRARSRPSHAALLRAPHDARRRRGWAARPLREDRATSSRTPPPTRAPCAHPRATRARAPASSKHRARRRWRRLRSNRHRARSMRRARRRRARAAASRSASCRRRRCRRSESATSAPGPRRFRSHAMERLRARQGSSCARTRRETQSNRRARRADPS